MAEIRFDQKVAVITGGGGGLGKAYALLLASRGAKLVVNDLGGSLDGTGSGINAAQKVVDEINALGGEALANFDSVETWESAQKIIRSAIDHFGRLDILINNAGILRDKSFAKMESDDYYKVIAVHLNGTFFCTKAAFTEMKNQAYGRIVSTASAAGLYGNFGQVNYGAAKMGIIGMMSCVAQEGARYNIKANTIVPLAGTRLTFTVMPEEMIGHIKPEYVAPIVIWLCSEECEQSAAIYSAGGGYFSRVALVEGPGLVLDPAGKITPEVIKANIDQIGDLTNSQEYSSALEQTGSIVSKTESKSF